MCQEEGFDAETCGVLARLLVVVDILGTNEDQNLSLTYQFDYEFADLWPESCCCKLATPRSEEALPEQTQLEFGYLYYIFTIFTELRCLETGMRLAEFGAILVLVRMAFSTSSTCHLVSASHHWPFKQQPDIYNPSNVRLK